MARLKRVVDETDATIVLSSDWRRDKEGLRFVRDQLRAMGMLMIGATPIMASMARPREITAWLGKVGSKMPRPIVAWVAVDDRLLLREPGGDQLRGHFVNTLFKSGLTNEKADAMIDILRSEGQPGKFPGGLPEPQTAVPSGTRNAAHRAQAMLDRARERRAASGASYAATRLGNPMGIPSAKLGKLTIANQIAPSAGHPAAGAIVVA